MSCSEFVWFYSHACRGCVRISPDVENDNQRTKRYDTPGARCSALTAFSKNHSLSDITGKVLGRNRGGCILAEQIHMPALVAGLDGGRAVPPSPWATNRRHVYFRILKNDCHHWLSRSFRVHQIRVRPGLCPGPRWGAYSDTIRYEMLF